MTSTLLLEVGCEELPTSFLEDAMGQLGKLIPEELARAGVGFGAVRAMGTPRRVAVVVEGVAAEIAPREEELLGPPASAAVDAQGAWTRAAEGFAKKNDLPLEALSLVDTPKGRYLRAIKRTPGATSLSLLPAALTAALRRVSFAKSMRWARQETAFGRPIQWIVALLDDAVVPLSFAGVEAGRVSYGHRFLAPEPIALAHASGYEAALTAAKVQADATARREAVLQALLASATAEGGTLRRDAFLEGEVTGLVEWPAVVVGRFDESFLDLPDALIESVMRGHQRYFAVEGAVRAVGGGKLLPRFLTVVNTALDPDTIRRGNERVMRARLNDAAFFVRQDRRATLGSRVASLDAVAFHARIGSYGDKARRLGALAGALAAELNAAKPGFVSVEEAARAGVLAKADLVTLAVGEFPELQGEMGGYYARHDGESDAVADALAQQYQPRGAADAVAPSALGAMLAIADRLDTLVGCFAAGLRPTGGEDPFGLRRAAIGILRTLLDHRLHLDLRAAVGCALAAYLAHGAESAAGKAMATEEARATLTAAVVDFCAERLKGLLDERFGRDPVAACMAAGKTNPVDVLERVEAVDAFWRTPAAQDLAVAFKRVFNISREAPVGALSDADRAHLVLPAEVELLGAFDATRDALSPLLTARDFVGAMSLIARTLRAPVDRFFNEVFVMDKDEALRAARLRLLGRIADAVGQLARFDALE